MKGGGLISRMMCALTYRLKGGVKMTIEQIDVLRQAIYKKILSEVDSPKENNWENASKAIDVYVKLGKIKSNIVSSC